MLNCVAALSLREAARRSIFFSLVLSFLPCSRPNRPFKTSRKRLKKKEKKKKSEKKGTDRLSRYYYSEYPKICPIFISSCLVCARACYTSHPSTLTHGKHYFFIYFNIFSFLSLFLSSSIFLLHF